LKTSHPLFNLVDAGIIVQHEILMEQI